MNRREIQRRLRKVAISPSLSIADAIRAMDDAGFGILLLCEEDKLVGVLTDGDVRRAILRNVPFDKACIEIASRDPVVAAPDVTLSEALRLMNRDEQFWVDHLPLVDQDRKVIGLILRGDLVERDEADISAVVMAGGLGTRLRPLTEDLPKPMLPVGGQPLIEIIVEQLGKAGIQDLVITTYYKTEKITKHFGDGAAFGVRIKYVTEGYPLGTAGALGLMQAPKQTQLVINGDILTRVDFRAVLAFHREHRAAMTVAVRRHSITVPYGVIEAEDSMVLRISERPKLDFFINAGIYLIEPKVYRFIVPGERLDMTDLIQRLLAEHWPVVSFPIREYWKDIGQHADYEQAQNDVRAGGLF